MIEVDDFVGLLAIEGDKFVAALVQLVVDFPQADGFVSAGKGLLTGNLGFGPRVVELGPRLRQLGVQLFDPRLVRVGLAPSLVGGIFQGLFRRSLRVRTFWISLLGLPDRLSSY